MNSSLKTVNIVLSVLFGIVLAACVCPSLALAMESAHGLSAGETPDLDDALAVGDAGDAGDVEMGALASYPDMEPYKRISGATRYNTADSVIGYGNEWGCFTRGRVVVTTGKNYPDALSAAALAGAYRCPIVLTDGKTLTDSALSVIRNSAYIEAIVIGGTSSVSNAVVSKVRGYGVSVRRVSGPDRYATSLKVYEAFRLAKRSAGYDTVIVATGGGFADALAMSPYSYAKGAPIVLAKGGKLSSAAVNAVKGDRNVKKIVIVGGTSAVKDSVRSQLGSGYAYTRLAGGDRYATAREVVKWELSHGMGMSHAAIATGANFPDALAGSAFCGAANSVLLLGVDNSWSCLSQLKGRGPQVSDLILFGGVNAVSPRVLGYARAMLYTGSKAQAKSYYQAQASSVKNYRSWDRRWAGSTVQMSEIGAEKLAEQEALMDEIIGYAKASMSASAAHKLDVEQSSFLQKSKSEANTTAMSMGGQLMSGYMYTIIVHDNCMRDNDARINTLISKYL